MPRYVRTKREDNCEVEGVEPFLHKTRLSGVAHGLWRKVPKVPSYGVNLVEAEVPDKTAIHHSKGFLSLHLLSIGPNPSCSNRQASKHASMLLCLYDMRVLEMKTLPRLAKATRQGFFDKNGKFVGGEVATMQKYAFSLGIE